MKTPQILTGILAAVLLLGMPGRAMAQDYDDDIYYNPSKTAKPKKKAKKIIYVPTPDYPAADTYSQPSYSTSTVPMRDIDEYNRRGLFAPVDTLDARTVNADTLGEFLYTHRIEAFHNPDVVTSTGNEDLINYYYNQGYQKGLNDGTTTNVVVNTYDPFWGPSYSWYYPYSSWRWRYSFYDPWYWGTSWGWDPYWSWSWNWGPSWGWGPGYWGPGYWGPNYWGPGHWHPGHGPGYIPGGSTAWRPSPGASRPHASTGFGTANGRQPGSSAGSSSVGGFNRPGNMGRGRYGSTGTTTTRPTYGGGSSANKNVNVNTGNSSYGNYGNRGRNNANRNNNSTNNSNTRYNNNTRNNNYNNNSNSSWGSSRGRGSSGGSSYGSGSSWGGRSGGGSYGGGSHGGGGGGRGRR